MSAGKLFRQALTESAPLPILGVINAYAAKLAQAAGAKAIYMSGAGLANSCFALPDLAMTSLSEVCEQANRIVDACDLPLLVDIDTGFGSVLTIARTIKLLEKAGVAAVHIEDQEFEKRCGHLDGKSLVSQNMMCTRIQAAVDARHHREFVIMARTDALAIESKQASLDRVSAYIEAGADMIFLEAIPDLNALSELSPHINVPILVNSTEFGKTAIYTQQEWARHGADMVLYPLSGFRAMSKICMDVYQTILQEGSQASILDKMQTRASLYDILDYENYVNFIAQGVDDE